MMTSLHCGAQRSCTYHGVGKNFRVLTPDRIEVNMYEAEIDGPIVILILQC